MQFILETVATCVSKKTLKVWEVRSAAAWELIMMGRGLAFISPIGGSNYIIAL